MRMVLKKPVQMFKTQQSAQHTDFNKINKL